MNPAVNPGSGTTVRVCVRTAGDVFAARLRATAALRSADLRPSSLPPPAVLFIRWMRVPRHIGAPADLAAGRLFERALRASVDDLARHAIRPADGTVGPCDAVVFSDLAELLACLARDWCDGLAGDRWWWRALLRARVTLDLIVKSWTESGPHIAAAFERLDAGGAVAFVSALDARQVRDLTAAMSAAFGGPSAADILRVRATAKDLSDIRDLRGTQSISSVVDAIAGVLRATGVAWSSTLFRDDQRGLAALAGIVRRRPSLLQHPLFVIAFHQVLQLAPMTTTDDAREASRAGSDSPSRPASVWRRDDADQNEATAPSARQGAAASPGLAESGAPMAGNIADPAVGDMCVEDASQAVNNGESLQELVSSPARPFHLDLARRASPTETPLGGIFYLLNVAIAMRLYGDFTMPGHRRLLLSPWDLLALVAEHWLGEPLDATTDRLLASLAGRVSGERPGTAFYSHARLARWIPRLTARINARVARSLGAPAGTDVARHLLCHRAHVHVSAAHVDVMFGLDSLPVDIRLAGLDRNPGWVPAAGRIVTFHYT